MIRNVSLILAPFVVSLSAWAQGPNEPEPGAESEPGAATEPATAAPAAGEGESTASQAQVEAEAQRARSELLRDLRAAEEEVHGLKERVFRSKAALQLLRELSIEGARSGAGLRITHVDKLGRSYAIESIQYYLDGKSLWSWTASEGATDPPDDLRIRDEAMSPGSHALQVSMVVRGNGRGVFQYLDDYRFTVDSSYAFEVGGGEITDLKVLAVSKGGVRKAFTERPTVVYEERREQLRAE